jgi:hypothetical protein
MFNFKNLIAAAALGGAAFAVSGGPTSAAIVCSGDDCWHAHETYTYPPDAHIEVHPDNWRWRGDEHRRWREHAGRGYWTNNEWRAF